MAEGLVGLGFAVQPPETNMVWCEPPAGLGAGGFDSIAARLHEEDRILVGGAYAGPAGRHHWGEPAKALRFVTHLQAGRPAVRALLGGLTRLLARR